MSTPAPFSTSARNVLIGMVHALPLPGSPGWGGSMATVAVPPETIAGLALVAARLATLSGLPIGINVLRNDARAALGIAAAIPAAFIRVNVHTGAMLTDQGWLTGRAYETLRQRRQLAAQIAVCADVLVKHAVPAPGVDLAEVARDTWQRGGADVLIVSGAASGAPTDPMRARAVKLAVPTAPLWIGSGVHEQNVQSPLQVAEGAIVGSSIKVDGQTANPVDPQRAGTLVAKARAG